MNKDKVLELALFIEQHPELEFDVGDWSCCPAAFAARMADGNNADPDTHTSGDTQDLINLMEITACQASEISMGWEDIDDDDDDDVGLPDRAVTVASLRQFAQTGEFKWLHHKVKEAESEDECESEDA